ncbi:MAG: hypothetical protein NVS9B4_22620 [Candidatus Acidiferrum sp.]
MAPKASPVLSRAELLRRLEAWGKLYIVFIRHDHAGKGLPSSMRLKFPANRSLPEPSEKSRHDFLNAPRLPDKGGRGALPLRVLKGAYRGPAAQTLIQCTEFAKDQPSGVHARVYRRAS